MNDDAVPPRPGELETTAHRAFTVRMRTIIHWRMRLIAKQCSATVVSFVSRDHVLPPILYSSTVAKTSKD